MLAVSLNAAVGRGAILLGLLVCAVGIVVTVTGIRRKNVRILRASPRYAYAAFAAAVLAFVMMERALITRDFSLAYVQQVGSRSTPALYNVTALWSALEGSILMWVLILSGFMVAVAVKFRSRRDDVLLAWAMVVMFVVSLFFFLLSFGPANPFALGPDRDACTRRQAGRIAVDAVALVMAIDGAAKAVLHAVDKGGFHAFAAIGEHGIGGDHLEQGGFLRAKAVG